MSTAPLKSTPLLRLGVGRVLIDTMGNVTFLKVPIAHWTEPSTQLKYVRRREAGVESPFTNPLA
jgi:hypothetical protein